MVKLDGARDQLLNGIQQNVTVALNVLTRGRDARTG